MNEKVSMVMPLHTKMISSNFNYDPERAKFFMRLEVRLEMGIKQLADNQLIYATNLKLVDERQKFVANANFITYFLIAGDKCMLDEIIKDNYRDIILDRVERQFFNLSCAHGLPLKLDLRKGIKENSEE